MLSASWLHLALRISIAIWGVPHCGQVHQRVFPGPLPDQSPLVLGWAYVPDWLTRGTPDYCEIGYNARHPWPWWEVCAVTIHEVGHLTYHHHSHDPNSLMYVFVHPDPQCDDFGRPFLRRHRISDNQEKLMARRKTRSRRSVIVTGSNSSIRTFTAKGSAAPGTIGTFSPTPLGHFDPTTGRVYQHPRVRANSLAAGSMVRVTNPAFSGPAGRGRTRSIGMGGLGQTGRNVGIVGGVGD